MQATRQIRENNVISLLLQIPKEIQNPAVQAYDVKRNAIKQITKSTYNQQNDLHTKAKYFKNTGEWAGWKEAMVILSEQIEVNKVGFSHMNLINNTDMVVTRPPTESSANMSREGSMIWRSTTKIDTLRWDEK